MQHLINKDLETILTYLTSRIDGNHRQISEGTGFSRAKVAKLLGKLKEAEKIHISNVEDGVPYYAVGSAIKEPEKEIAMDVITDDYDRGYQDGYKAAITKMKRRLTEMSKGK